MAMREKMREREAFLHANLDTILSSYTPFFLSRLFIVVFRFVRAFFVTCPDCCCIFAFGAIVYVLCAVCTRWNATIYHKICTHTDARGAHCTWNVVRITVNTQGVWYGMPSTKEAVNVTCAVGGDASTAAPTKIEWEQWMNSEKRKILRLREDSFSACLCVCVYVCERERKWT